MAAPLVYVSVLNYNTRDMTLQLIESLQRMTYPNFRIVVVDNGSTDGCVEAVSRRWPGIPVIALPNNLGHTGGCNAGLEYGLAQGADYLLPLNSDMMVDPRFADELVAVAEQDPSYGFVTPRIYTGYPPSEEICAEGGYYSLWTGFYDGIGRGRTVPREAHLESREVDFTDDVCLARVEMLRRIGLLDDGLFAYCEGMDWSLKAKKAGYKIVTAPRAQIWHLEVRATTSAWRYRINTRNMLKVHWRHARWYHCPTAWLWIGARWLAYMSLREILRGHWHETAALWKGVGDAIAGRTGSPPR